MHLKRKVSHLTCNKSVSKVESCSEAMDQDFSHSSGIKESFSCQGVVRLKSLRFGWVASRVQMQVDVFGVGADENSGAVKCVLQIDRLKINMGLFIHYVIWNNF